MIHLLYSIEDLNSSPKISDSIWKEISDNILIFSHNSRKLYTLNSMGKIIWKLCDGTHTVNEIINQIASEYNEEMKIIKEDVIDFIIKLKTFNLIVLI